MILLLFIPFANLPFYKPPQNEMLGCAVAGTYLNPLLRSIVCSDLFFSCTSNKFYSLFSFSCLIAK